MIINFGLISQFWLIYLMLQMNKLKYILINQYYGIAFVTQLIEKSTVINLINSFKQSMKYVSYTN